MEFYRVNTFISLLFAILFLAISGVHGQNRDNLPAEFREYTNPEEVVTFDRTTPFQRAVDVVNTYAQKYRGKMVLDKTKTEGDIGISVPPMHWMDALKLILRVKDLMLVEKKDYYEIVTKESQMPEDQQKAAATGKKAAGAKGGEAGPVATTKTHEVRINAIFFEGSRRALQEIGVDWSTLSENVPEEILGGGQQGGGGGQGGGQGSGAQVPDSRFDGPFVQVNSRAAQNVSQNVFDALVNVGEIGNTGIEVQALFSAFEADNLGEILASPTIKVMEGEQGRIQVGQDFSIKQRDIAGNVVEKFFSVGTILEVTPTVLEQKDTTFVHLDINAERSTAQPDPVSTIINKTQATTQTLLMDGEATVIAGLYSTEQNEVRRGIPILKDLPPWFFGLRYLFGYNSSDTQMRELVILLKVSLEPRIADRASKEDFRSKYEVLRDERQRVREEIEKSQQAKEMENIPAGEDLNKNNEADTAEVKKKADIQKSEDQDSTASKSPQKKKINKQEKDQKEAPVIKDPEVKTKKVQLDLGGEDKTAKADSVSKEKEVSKVEKKEPQKVQQAPEMKYYIIGGSFRNESNARSYHNQLEEKGFNASIIRKKDGWMMVSYSAYDNVDKARSALNKIQQQNAGAWLYKAK